MLISVHYSVNNHHIARSVLEEASLKKENKSVLKKQCVIIQHIDGKSTVCDFNHGTVLLLGSKLHY